MTNGPSGAKILVVEDDKDILTVLKDQLELDGFEVKTALNGKTALEIFSHFNPDLILLDLNLPDIDGLRVCQKIRAHTQETAVIMLTARDRLCDKVRGFETGCDDYIVKPFEYLELQARIKAVLRRKSSTVANHEVMDFGTIKIFPQKREVKVQGNPIKLTKKEYDLLELFAAHPNKVLKREFIISELWPNKELYSWSRALDVHILRLRHKIEPDPECPRYIITHPGVGYRFRTDEGQEKGLSST